jgi:uncharacterized protein (DUF2336 family)
MTLVVEAERDIRHRLSERLADADWAPSALINIMALDEIEIARPIIARSPVLQDHDLIRLLVQATLEHQIEIARRPRLPAPVVEAIISRDEPAVLTALASNDTAEISPDAMGRLVSRSREVVALRSPLARHPKLSSDLAEQLYLLVGRALRDALIGALPPRSRPRCNPPSTMLCARPIAAKPIARSAPSRSTRIARTWSDR